MWKRDDHVEVEIHNAPIPEPGPSEILIKVVVSGTNPKDWKLPFWFETNGVNTGDDMAGYVQAVGKDVTEFRVGDRVAAFHVMRTSHGSFAEYAVSPAHTAFVLPSTTTFEEAATIPLAATTAVMALFACLGLPEPWHKREEDRAKTANGVLVYGGATAVGGFVIKLLRKVDVHPIYVVAGKGTDFVNGLLDNSKGDRVFDYRQGSEAMTEEIKEALGGRLFRYAVDCVAENKTWKNIVNFLEPGGHVTGVLPNETYEGFPEGKEHTYTYVGAAHESERELAIAWFRLFAMGLREGWLTPHPHEVVPGGLNGVQTALQNLKDGKASAVKYVLRIEETPGL